VSLERGIALFNEGRYWEAHEAWEEVWTLDRRGPERSFYKGLIQVAAGCLHYLRGNRRGTLNKWRGGAAYLREVPPLHQGVRVGDLVTAVDAMLLAMADPGWPKLAMPLIQAAPDE